MASELASRSTDSFAVLIENEREIAVCSSNLVLVFLKLGAERLS